MSSSSKRRQEKRKRTSAASAVSLTCDPAGRSAPHNDSPGVKRQGGGGQMNADRVQ